MKRLSVVVIGGGPAGASAAWGLARTGADVTVIEGRAFPRVKVCGEFVSPAATVNLERMLGRADLIAAGGRRCDRLALEINGRERVWPLPEPAWALSRAELDTRLIEAAQRAGARVVQPMSVLRVEYSGDAVRTVLADGSAVESDVVIHADGSGRHDPAGPTPNRPGVVGHKCHLRVPGESTGGTVEVRMRAGAGAYVGTIGVEGGLSTCALVARSPHIARHGGDADAMLAELWPGYEPAWRVGDWKSCGVAGSGYITPGHARSLRIGNAAAAVEPVGGEGIGLALWSGQLAAELLAAHAPAGLAHVHSQMARAYRRRLLTRRPACRLAAEVLMRPWLVRVLWPLLAAPALTIRPWYRLSGKPAAG